MTCRRLHGFWTGGGQNLNPGVWLHNLPPWPMAHVWQERCQLTGAERSPGGPASLASVARPLRDDLTPRPSSLTAT